MFNNSDDITYCARDDCAMTSCFRHYNNIDWNTPKHKSYGATLADFGLTCPNYDKDITGGHCIMDNAPDELQDSEVDVND